MAEALSWSTDAADIADCTTYWRRAIGEAILPLDFVPYREDFAARLDHLQLGAVGLSAISISASYEIARTDEGIARKPANRLHLNYIVRGAWSVHHDRKRIDLAAGDVLLLDPRMPYHIVSTGEAQHYCLTMPLSWLSLWFPDPEAPLARAIRRGEPGHAALAARIEATALAAPEAAGAAALCAEQIAGALALALGPPRVKRTRRARELYFRVLQVMAMRAHEQGLDAEKVAEELCISVRYLHKVFASANTFYLQELFRIRLEHAYAMIRNSNFDRVSTSEISWRCGFCDVSHFTKRFRRAYGVTPGALRLRLKRGSAQKRS